MISAAFCLLATCARSDGLYELGWSRRPVGLQSSLGVGQAITMDGFGKLYAVGITGLRQQLLLKYDQGGNQLWAREFGRTGTGLGAVSVATDVAGNIFVGGESSGASLTKWDSNGNQLWEASFNVPQYLSEVYSGLAVDGAGSAYALTHTGLDLAFKKYSASGDELWSRTIPRSFGSSVSVDGNGDIFIASTYNPLSGNDQTQILKYDSAGNQLWRQTFTVNLSDRTFDVVVHPSGDIYIAGSSRVTLGGQRDAFLARLDASGDLIWTRQVGGTLDDSYNALEFDELGRIIVTGMGRGDIFQAGIGERDALLAVYDPDGSRVWGMQLGSDRMDSSRGIVRSPTGELYITGDLRSSNNYLYTSAWIQQLVPVPEPSTYALALLGAIALIGFRGCRS